MKKLILILIFVISFLTISAQDTLARKEYKNFKSCTECFDQWKKTGLQNYGIPEPRKRDGFGKVQVRNFTLSIIGIFVSVGTLVIYNKINNTANAIR